jgi:hypothetical protein
MRDQQQGALKIPQLSNAKTCAQCASLIAPYALRAANTLIVALHRNCDVDYARENESKQLSSRAAEHEMA